ncbi:OmpA family protein, partial [Acidisphaera sp. L21]|uniref:OmpA family protein n=1 Tax=Acidisphaera sp. L21 TaxID=1641851 RepID=UPI00131D9025
VLPAIPAPPARPVTPPSPVPVVPDATGIVTPVPGGIRITFGDGKSDLNPATEAAIRTMARSVVANTTADLNIYAFAAGVPDDPSTPRRVSLSRALAVRAILISEGITSTRIYPRALGASPGPNGSDGPPDRVDLVLAGTNPAAKP